MASGKVGLSLAVFIAVVSLGLGVMWAVVGEAWPALTSGWSFGVWTMIVVDGVVARG